LKSQLEVRKLNYQLETVFLLQVDSFCGLGGRFPMLATQTRDKKNGCRGAGIFRLVTHSLYYSQWQSLHWQQSTCLNQPAIPGHWLFPIWLWVMTRSVLLKTFYFDFVLFSITSLLFTFNFLQTFISYWLFTLTFFSSSN
jgi:hypothetical protein